MMKAQKMSRAIRSIFLAFAVMMIVTLTSCEKKIIFLNSTVVPGADGYIKVKKDNNKNYIIKVEVSDLAEVERVQASKTTYVVWMETDEGNAENLGQLISSKSFFSKRNSASLETVSSYKPAKIFITTEEGINTQYPGRQVVLTTENFTVK
jgi:hypothetical protein